VLVVLGLLIALAGAALAFNLGGAADFVIRHLTSRSLGTLAPGFAASKSGIRVYGFLLSSFSVVLLGLAELDWRGGIFVVGLGIVGFVVNSVAVIRGEIATYRALKH
jgi:hypothetical protein